MDHYLQIRLLHRDGLSIRQIARKLGHSRDTVKRALLRSTPLPYTRTAPATCPKLGAFIGQIEQILTEDQAAPRKQRHTAARIFQRLRDEHQYLGGYDQVRRFVATHRKRERETHLLLDHPPGGRVECDFGHIHVDFPDGRRPVPVLLAVWRTLKRGHKPFMQTLKRGHKPFMQIFDIVNVFSHTTFTSGHIVNQVADVYDGLWRLSSEYQAVDGVADTSMSSATPKVQYVYSDISDGNGSRLTEMAYPNGEENGTRAVEGAGHIHHK